MSVTGGKWEEWKLVWDVRVRRRRHAREAGQPKCSVGV